MRGWLRGAAPVRPNRHPIDQRGAHRRVRPPARGPDAGESPEERTEWRGGGWNPGPERPLRAQRVPMRPVPAYRHSLRPGARRPHAARAAPPQPRTGLSTRAHRSARARRPPRALPSPDPSPLSASPPAPAPRTAQTSRLPAPASRAAPAPRTAPAPRLAAPVTQPQAHSIAVRSPGSDHRLTVRLGRPPLPPCPGMPSTRPRPTRLRPPQPLPETPPGVPVRGIRDRACADRRIRAG